MPVQPYTIKSKKQLSGKNYGFGVAKAAMTTNRLRVCSYGFFEMMRVGQINRLAPNLRTVVGGKPLRCPLSLKDCIVLPQRYMKAIFSRNQLKFGIKLYLARVKVNPFFYSYTRTKSWSPTCLLLYFQTEIL